MVVTQIGQLSSKVNKSVSPVQESDAPVKFSEVLEKTAVHSNPEEAEQLSQQAGTDQEGTGKKCSDNMLPGQPSSENPKTEITAQQAEVQNQQQVCLEGMASVGLNVQQVTAPDITAVSNPADSLAPAEVAVSAGANVPISPNDAGKGIDIHAITDTSVKVVAYDAQSGQTAVPDVPAQPQQTGEQVQADPQQQNAQTQISGSMNAENVLNEDQSNAFNLVKSDQNGADIKAPVIKNGNGEKTVDQTQSFTGTSQTQSDIMAGKAEENIAGLSENDVSKGNRGNTDSNSRSGSNEPKVAQSIDDGIQVLSKTDHIQTAKSETAQSSPRVIFNQITAHISENLKTGNTDFTFELNPQQLGKISVKMSVENSNLIIEISASNANTQSILQANSDDIKSMLQSHFGQHNQVSDFSSAGQNDSNYWQENKEKQDNGRQAYEQPQNDKDDEEMSETFTSDFLSIMQMLRSI